MKNYLPLISLYLLTISLQAQSPIWAEETFRRQKYPVQTYLTGYFVAQNNQNEPSDEFINKQIEAAKTELINSIYVNLASLTELDIANTTSGSQVTTEELFRLKSASFSKANISGISVEKAYDNNTKTAYAFAYAQRSEVIAYNKKLLEENKMILEGKIQEAASYKSSANNQLALKAYYECMPFFREVETAQSVLVALQNNLNIPNRAYYNEAKTKVNKGIAELQGSNQLTLDDVCYFMAYGLFVQTEELRDYVQLLSFTFENKGFESNFSNQFEARFEKKLVEVTNYRVGKSAPTFSANNAYTLQGSYWKEGNLIKIIANLKDADEKTIASSEGQLPMSWLENKNIEIIPEILKRLALLEDIQLKAQNPRIETKINRLDKDLAVVMVSSKAGNQALNNIPLKFILPKNNSVLARASSDNAGTAKGLLTSLQASNIPQRINAIVDDARFLGLDPASTEYKRLAPSLPNSAVAPFVVKVSGLNVFVESEELNHTGEKLAVPVLVPSIKNVLTKNGYSFTDDFAKADLYVTLNSNIDEIKSPGALQFAYLNCEVSVTEMETGKIIYGNTFERIKGGGGSAEGATTKAYKTAANQIAEGLKTALKL